MKETYWSYWLVILGIFIIGVMLLVNNISTTDTNDYYNIKEVTQAAMIDAVDYSYYRLYGNIKMSEQKFVENFIRRFADNVSTRNRYRIEFYDLYEVPPKVSVRISTNTNNFNVANTIGNNYDVTTTLTAVLELGVTGGDEGSVKDGDTHKCDIYVYSELMKFFSDESGVCATGIDGNCVNYKTSGRSFDSRLVEAAKSGDSEKFRDTFKSVYSSDLGNMYSNWSDSLRYLYEQGWLRVSLNK